MKTSCVMQVSYVAQVSYAMQTSYVVVRVRPGQNLLRFEVLASAVASPE